MIKSVVDNFKMISPAPAFWWLAIGYVAQKLHPPTKLNADNMSETSLQLGVSFLVLITLFSLFISMFWEKSPNESRFLQFLYTSAKQFSELAMAIFGFSAAYYIHYSEYKFSAIILLTAVSLASAMNHLYLIVFNQQDVGTLNRPDFIEGWFI